MAIAYKCAKCKADVAKPMAEAIIRAVEAEKNERKEGEDPPREVAFSAACECGAEIRGIHVLGGGES